MGIVSSARTDKAFTCWSVPIAQLAAAVPSFKAGCLPGPYGELGIKWVPTKREGTTLPETFVDDTETLLAVGKDHLFNEHEAIEVGDLLLGINGQPIFSLPRLLTVLDKHIRGPLTLRLGRGLQDFTVEVHVKDLDDISSRRFLVLEGLGTFEDFGLRHARLASGRRRLGGVYTSSLQSTGNPSFRLSHRVFKEANGRPVENIIDFEKVIRDICNSDGSYLWLKLELADTEGPPPRNSTA